MVKLIRPLSFFGLSSLQKLLLTSNRISALSANSFVGLYNLAYLHMDSNAIKYIAPCAFGGLSKIKVLTLKRNNLTEIRSAMLCGLENLQYLDLSFNLVTALQISHTIPGITINVHSVEFCCLLPKQTECVPLNLDKTVPYKCPQLLKNKIVLWFLSLAIILPNIVAPICWRKMKKSHGSMTFLVSLLHIIDGLIVVAIIVPAVADVYYGSSYTHYAYEWTQSVICKAVAYIGYVTFILSISCMTLITRQRYLGIAYPLHKRNISRRAAITYISTSFIFSSSCVLATFLTSNQSGSFQLNPLCMIYAQPNGGMKSNWLSCFYIIMNMSVIPVIYFSIAAVSRLLKADTVLLKTTLKKAKPVFKMVFTLVVYVLICGSLSIMEIIHIWHPLTDICRLVVFVLIFPLHSLTNPWMITMIQ